MADCRHGLDDRWCSTCLHGVQHDQAQYLPAVERPQKPKAKPDRFMAKVDAILDGRWCADCDTPIERGLCAHLREERFELHADVLHEWSRQIPGTPKARRSMHMIAHGVLGREILRAGIGDQEQPGLRPGVSRRQAEMALDRAGGLDAGTDEVEPKWKPFTNTKADELPLPA